MPYILDTNALGEYLHKGTSTPLGARIGAIHNKRVNVRTTIITFQEMLAGRIKEIEKPDNHPSRPEPLHVRFFWLAVTYIELRRYYPPLAFTPEAQRVFESLPRNVKQNARIRDCRIASIQVALGPEWTVITADQKDFRIIEKVIPVQWEDWTIRPMV